MTLTFRPAGPADVPALVTLIESAYRGESSRAGWTTEEHLLGGQRTDAEAVGAAVRADRGVVLVAEAEAEAGRQLAGCCWVEPRPGGLAYFGMFAVRPGQQGQGWGGQILAEAERLARAEWQATAMTMTVLAQRPDLIAWYERRGYAPTGESEPFPYGNARYGLPKRPDLSFTVLAKPLTGEAGSLPVPGRGQGGEPAAGGPG